MKYVEPSDDEIFGLITSVTEKPVEIQPRELGFKDNTFLCSICGQPKLEKYSGTAKYCVDCYRGYQSYRSRILRKLPDVKVTMDAYRDHREREGLPVASGSTIKRGRPKKPAPDDLDTMDYVTFWRYVVAKAEERFGPMTVLVQSEKHGQQEATAKGQYDVVFKFHNR